MAPYQHLLRGMKRRDMQIVVTFLQEAMAEDEQLETAMSKADLIHEKYKSLQISEETKELVSGLSLSADEMQDERTKYLLGYDR